MSDRSDHFDVRIHHHGDSRSLEVDMDLEAAPAEVWRALTEAERLRSWFPLQAEVTPGVGGKIHMSWDGAWESDLEIQIWEPGADIDNDAPILDRGRPGRGRERGRGRLFHRGARRRRHPAAAGPFRVSGR